MAGAKNGALNKRARRLMESESRWLQKALFALSKARHEREKLAEQIKADEDLEVMIKGKAFELSTVRTALSEAVQERAENLRESVSKRQAVLR